MDVDRQVEFLRLRQDRLERRIVEEAPVGGAVHQHAMEPEVFHGPLQFDGGLFGRQHRQVGEAAIAAGMAGAGLGQRVVVGAGHVDALLPRHQVGARTGHREHLHGDAAGVHVRQPNGAEVGEFGALGDLRPDDVRAGKTAPGDRLDRDAGDDAGDGIVFFQCDDAHAVFLPWGWAGGCHAGRSKAMGWPHQVPAERAGQGRTDRLPGDVGARRT